MLHRLRFFIQKRFPVLYTKIVRISNIFHRLKSREKRKRLGDLNPEKKIYIIRVRRETLGLMGYYMSVLGHIHVAKEKNALPVVDMMNYKNPYLSDKEFKKTNAWEYYFEQIDEGVSLAEAYKSKHVILSQMETPFEANPRWFYEQVYLKEKMYQYFEMVEKYIRFNSGTKEILQQNFDTILKPVFDQGCKILGVVSRGTDILGFPGHSIQPTTEKLLELTISHMKKYNCDYVFMASDSDYAIDYFKKVLGTETVLSNECKRYDRFEASGVKVLGRMRFERENDEYLKGIEYLTTVYLLSKCNVLFGSLVGSTVGALCMNCGEYEQVEIFDEGTYIR